MLEVFVCSSDMLPAGKGTLIVSILEIKAGFSRLTGATAFQPYWNLLHVLAGSIERILTDCQFVLRHPGFLA